MSELKCVAAELKQLKTALLVSHVSPDPDAIGSCAGLALGLQSCGIEASVFLPHAPPRSMQSFIKGVKLVDSAPTAAFESLIVVDTATRQRINGYDESWVSLAEKTFNIDHHISNDAWADVNLIDASSAASAQIVFHLLQELEVPLTGDIANLLFAGIMDDTGCFRFSNTDASALKSVSELVTAGALPEHVANELYFSIPFNVLKLRQAALAELNLVLDDRVSLMVVTQEMLTRVGATGEDTEGLVDEARMVQGTIAAVFMRELDDGWKVSLRAKTAELDVQQVAERFGGGGHRAAAGCKVLGTRAQAEKAVSDALSDVLRASQLI